MIRFDAPRAPATAHPDGNRPPSNRARQLAPQFTGARSLASGEPAAPVAHLAHVRARSSCAGSRHGILPSGGKFE